MLSRMRADPEGREVLRLRPRVSAEAMEKAWGMPPATLGGAYAQFMGSRRFNPDDRMPVRAGCVGWRGGIEVGGWRGRPSAASAERLGASPTKALHSAGTRARVRGRSSEPPRGPGTATVNALRILCVCGKLIFFPVMAGGGVPGRPATYLALG